MKRTFLASVLLISTLSSAFAQSKQPHPADTLLVMTFNIRFGTANDGKDHWENRKEMLFDVLRRYNPDIIGMQEALRFQLDEIRTTLPHYAEVGAGRDDGKAAGEFSAILFRSDRFSSVEDGTFWFSDTPEIPGSMTWGNSFPRICSWTRLVEKTSGSTFRVYNVHLDHVSQPSREKSVAALMQNIQQSDPVIVTGDFNAGEQNPAILFLKGDTSVHLSAPNAGRIQLVDSYRSLHPDEKAVGTFHAFRGNTDGDKIDFVFVEPGTPVLEAAILHDNVNGRYPSDHFPVIARIVLIAARK
jgi:endonuclease/exonuclease/phosphatase family metal-dependent hydrolase